MVKTRDMNYSTVSNDSQSSWCDDEDSFAETQSSTKKTVYRRIDFRDDEEEKLIELVKSKSHLYCVTDSDYKDRHLKVKAWEEIAKTLSKSSEDCKKKWKNIKDTYDRSRKKMPTGSGASSSQITKRMEMLAFLDTSPSVNTKYVINIRIMIGVNKYIYLNIMGFFF